MIRNSKPESSRLNLFYILQILERYTNEDNPLSAAEIAEKVNKDFGYLNSNGTIMSADTVKRTLEELVDKIFPTGLNYSEIAHKYGFCIYCVMKKGKEYVSYHLEQGKQPPKKYYYLEDDLTTAEILTLKNAIETYSYFSEEDITEIVQKLISLRPSSFPRSKYVDWAKEERDEDSLLLMNIDKLNEIIVKQKCAKITYCAYNFEKKLEPRQGYPRIVEPLNLMWGNGYYYLLAFSEKYENIVSYRIDRITHIDEVDKKNNKIYTGFNPVSYRYQHPIMFGGKKENFVLLCRDTGKNHIMNIIMDTFGKNAKIVKADETMLQKYLGHSLMYYEKQGITWLRLSVDVTPGGIELWVSQYCNDCFIVSPQESALRVKERLSRGVDYYRNCLENDEIHVN